MKTLFSPLRLNSKYQLKNRLALAPMTTSQSHPDGRVSLEEAAWLERTAADGYGMIISCAAAISKDSIAFENQLSFEDDQMLPDLIKLSGRLKKYDCISLIQLCHAGSRAIKSKAYSASSYRIPEIPDFIPPEMLSVKQIEEIISDFAAACIRVAEAGFDGVEFHGANGYLFTQFISRMTNLREDQYGGGLENRARFARETVRACRKVVPSDFMIGFRISFENMGFEKGLDIDENIQVINWLAEDGISYAHISSLDYSAKSAKYPDQVALKYIRSKITGSLPLVGVGSIKNFRSAEEAMELGADMVAIGRAAIGNRNIPKLFANREELPNENPFPESLLTSIGISKLFINYLRKMPVASLNVVE